MSVTVLRGGLQTLVQDRGRIGYARYGVPESGALDGVSLRLANMLVGNDQGAAALELAIDGPHLLFNAPAVVAVVGADMSPEVDGMPLPRCRPVWLGAGSIVRFSGARVGTRAYLAIAGGIDVPVVMRSRSTDLRGGYGGFEGRALHAGDQLAPLASRPSAVAAPDGGFVAARWSLAGDVQTPMPDEARVRIVLNERHHALCRRLAGVPFTVDAMSDRIGVRLTESVGEHGLSVASEPTPCGTLQLPPDGRPILLLNDHPTTGGYPAIAHIASVDLPLVAQLRPGTPVRFDVVDRERATLLRRGQEQQLRRLSRWIELQRAG